MQTSFSHAAPYIRQQLVYAVDRAETSKTLKGREVGYAVAGALADALRIMADSADQTPVDGIAGIEELPRRGVMFAKKFLGSPDNVKKILGIDVAEPMSHPFMPGDGYRTYVDQCQHPGCGAHQSQHAQEEEH